MSTQCQYCAEITPFYNEIAESSRMKGYQTCVAAVFSDPENEVLSYVQAKSLKLEAIGGFDLTKIQVAVTPTIILVDDAGAVLDFWVGTTGEQEKKEILRAVRKETY